MNAIIRLYSNVKGEISKFLNNFYELKIDSKDDLEWEKSFENPLEIATIIGTFIENSDKYNISIWICIDEGCFIHVTDENADEIIRYLYERFPY